MSDQILYKRNFATIEQERLIKKQEIFISDKTLNNIMYHVKSIARIIQLNKRTMCFISANCKQIFFLNSGGGGGGGGASYCIEGLSICFDQKEQFSQIFIYLEIKQLVLTLKQLNLVIC